MTGRRLSRRRGDLAIAVATGGAGQLVDAIDLLALRHEGADDRVDVLLEPNLTRTDLAQRGHSRLVGALDQPRRTDGDLPGPAGRQDHQREVIVDPLQTVFDRYSCHLRASFINWGVFPAHLWTGVGGLPLAPRRRSHPATAAPGSRENGTVSAAARGINAIRPKNAAISDGASSRRFVVAGGPRASGGGCSPTQPRGRAAAESRVYAARKAVV